MVRSEIFHHRNQNQDVNGGDCTNEELYSIKYRRSSFSPTMLKKDVKDTGRDNVKGRPETINFWRSVKKDYKQFKRGMQSFDTDMKISLKEIKCQLSAKPPKPRTSVKEIAINQASGKVSRNKTTTTSTSIEYEPPKTVSNIFEAKSFNEQNKGHIFRSSSSAPCSRSNSTIHSSEDLPKRVASPNHLFVVQQSASLHNVSRSPSAGSRSSITSNDSNEVTKISHEHDEIEEDDIVRDFSESLTLGEMTNASSPVSSFSSTSSDDCELEDLE